MISMAERRLPHACAVLYYSARSPAQYVMQQCMILSELDPRILEVQGNLRRRSHLSMGSTVNNYVHVWAFFCDVSCALPMHKGRAFCNM